MVTKIVTLDKKGKCFVKEFLIGGNVNFTHYPDKEIFDEETPIESGVINRHVFEFNTNGNYVDLLTKILDKQKIEYEWMDANAAIHPSHGNALNNHKAKIRKKRAVDKKKRNRLKKLISDTALKNGYLIGRISENGRYVKEGSHGSCKRVYKKYANRVVRRLLNSSLDEENVLQLKGKDYKKAFELEYRIS